MHRYCFIGRVDPANLDALYAIFDDKAQPYYEHRLAA